MCAAVKIIRHDCTCVTPKSDVVVHVSETTVICDAENYFWSSELVERRNSEFFRDLKLLQLGIWSLKNSTSLFAHPKSHARDRDDGNVVGVSVQTPNSERNGMKRRCNNGKTKQMFVGVDCCGAVHW